MAGASQSARNSVNTRGFVANSRLAGGSRSRSLLFPRKQRLLGRELKHAGTRAPVKVNTNPRHRGKTKGPPGQNARPGYHPLDMSRAPPYVRPISIRRASPKDRPPTFAQRSPRSLPGRGSFRGTRRMRSRSGICRVYRRAVLSARPTRARGGCERRSVINFRGGDRG